MTRKDKTIMIAVALVAIGFFIGITALSWRAVMKLPEWWSADPLSVVGGVGAILFVIGIFMCMWLHETEKNKGGKL